MEWVVEWGHGGVDRGRPLPCLATMRLAMQSGTLVPAARNVMPMITSGIPRVKPMIVTCTHTLQLCCELMPGEISKRER